MLTCHVVHSVNNNQYRKRIKTSKETPQQRIPIEEERMEVDNVVYISDLDSDSESDTDEKVVFLPDIERKLNKIPYSLAGSDRLKDQPTSTELVLYTIPSSISIPEQKDVVRRAIIESRQRLRQKHVENTPNEVPPLTRPRDELNDSFSSVNDEPSIGSSEVWSGMQSEGASGSASRGWGSWSSFDVGVSMGASEGFENLDAMEIE